MNWHLANKKTVPSLVEILKINEWRQVNLSERLRRSRKSLFFGRMFEGSLWVREKKGKINGGLYLSQRGELLPGFDQGIPDKKEDIFLTKLLRSRRRQVFSIIGQSSRVKHLEQLLDEVPRRVDNYRILIRKNNDVQQKKSGSGLVFHRAQISDLDALWPLERAYLFEEVLHDTQRFNDRAGRHHFLEILLSQELHFITFKGRPVAKANTNARGWHYDQIGGVYVLPELRKKGLAQKVMEKLLESIQSEGRCACLFVKNSNPIALQLYRKLNFQDQGPFRISYWD